MAAIIPAAPAPTITICLIKLLLQRYHTHQQVSAMTLKYQILHVSHVNPPWKYTAYGGLVRWHLHSIQ